MRLVFPRGFETLIEFQVCVLRGVWGRCIWKWNARGAPRTSCERARHLLSCPNILGGSGFYNQHSWIVAYVQFHILMEPPGIRFRDRHVSISDVIDKKLNRHPSITPYHLLLASLPWISKSIIKHLGDFYIGSYWSITIFFLEFISGLTEQWVRWVFVGHNIGYLRYLDCRGGYIRKRVCFSWYW